MVEPENHDSHRLSPAAEAFARYLLAYDQGEAPPFADYCAAHPEHADALHRLHQRWAEANTAMQDFENAEAVAPVAPVELGVEQEPPISLRHALPPTADMRSPTARYGEHQVIARGGMGEIQRVWDADLRRAIAMKVLREANAPSHTDHRTPHSAARQQRRFLDEAQITAQLQHPGIVPVHELGLDADGRLYFTMNLVRGQNLRDVLRLARAGEDGWTRARVLEVLRRVCEAVAYAHDRGVIHRDLKPLNIMVGRFGETYVMDWGLARVLRRDEPAAPATGAEPAPPDPLAAQTLDGDVVGTPAYMPPEQARGELDRVGPPADVYAIGAMLYELLSGEMPYVPSGTRTSSHAVLERLIAGPPEPLKAAVDVPAELVAICERAMARDPQARYATVGKLGEDLAAFLEMRVVRAYESGTWAELRKWLRRNKALSATAALAVLALVVGLLMSLVQKNRADEQSVRADGSFKLAFAAVDRMLSRMGSRLAGVPRAQEVQRDLLEDALEFHTQFLATRSDDPSLRYETALAQLRVGRIHAKLGSVDRALSHYETACQQLTALLIDQPQHRDAEWELADAEHSIALQLILRGEHQRAIEVGRRALVRADALAREPGANRKQRGTQALIGATLGGALIGAGNHAEAVLVVQRAIEQRRALCREAPEDAAGLRELGVLLNMMTSSLPREHDQDQVEAILVEASAVLERAVTLDATPENLKVAAQIANNYAVRLLLPAQRHAEAELQLGKTRDFGRKLVEDFPSVPAYHGLLSGALSNLAELRRNTGDPEAALTLLEEAVAIEREAVRRAPDVQGFQRYLINQLRKLGELLVELGRIDRAAACAEELAALPFGDGLPRYFAAAILATCAVADSDTDHTARALELLAKSIEQPLAQRGPFENPAFQGLRAHPEFLRLEAAYAAQAAK